MNDIGCIVKDVSSKNQHRDWKSYKMTTPSHLAKQILSRDNWPDGIQVRQFHPSFSSSDHHVATTVTKNNDTVTTNTASANAETTHIPRDKASHGLDEIEGLTMINRTVTEDAVNMTCKITTNNGMTATSRNTTDNDNTTTGHTATEDGEAVNPKSNTFTTLKHIGLNAKGFKQSSLYITELLSDDDTVSISETWLRPGELCIIKPTLMNTPALDVLNDEDTVIYTKSRMTTTDPCYVADRMVVSLWHVNIERTCSTLNWILWATGLLM